MIDLADNKAICVCQLKDRWQATNKFSHALISLLEDERLTSRVDDEAAAVLIEWGSFGVQNVIRRALSIPVRDRDDMLERGLKSVKRLMRAAGNLVCQNEFYDDEKVSELLNIIALSRNHILGRPLQIPSGDRFLDIVHSDEWNQLSQADRLILLIDLLFPGNIALRPQTLMDEDE